MTTRQQDKERAIEREGEKEKCLQKPSRSIQKDVSIKSFELAETYDPFVNRLTLDDIWIQNTIIL